MDSFEYAYDSTSYCLCQLYIIAIQVYLLGTINVRILLPMTTLLRSIYRDNKLLGLLGFAFIILLIGVLFYSSVEHWSALNALYFSVITLTTVGYGDLTPKTDLGKMFTIAYIFIGLGVILGLVSIIARHATDKYSQLTESYFEKTEKDINSAIKKALNKK